MESYCSALKRCISDQGDAFVIHRRHRVYSINTRGCYCLDRGFLGNLTSIYSTFIFRLPFLRYPRSRPLSIPVGNPSPPPAWSLARVGLAGPKFFGAWGENINPRPFYIHANHNTICKGAFDSCPRTTLHLTRHSFG
jgi:hypothetical protein